MTEKSIALRIVSGWGVAPTILDEFIKMLPAHFDVRSVDIPDLAEGQRLSAEQRAAVLLEHAPSNAYWLGWSLGGAIALDLARHNPSRVRGVITLATNPCFVGQPDWPGMELQQFEAFLQGYQQNPAKTLQRFASLQTGGARDPRGQLRELKTHLLAPQTVLSDLLQLLAEDRRELIQNLEMPVMSVFASDDALVPAKVAQNLAGLGSGVRAEVICGASHLMFQDQPLTLSESIVDWIDLQERKYAR